MRVYGTFQMINGYPSIVGTPEGWTIGFDDWIIHEGARIVVEIPDQDIYKPTEEPAPAKKKTRTSSPKGRGSRTRIAHAN